MSVNMSVFVVALLLSFFPATVFAAPVGGNPSHFTVELSGRPGEMTMPNSSHLSFQGTVLEAGQSEAIHKIVTFEFDCAANANQHNSTDPMPFCEPFRKADRVDVWGMLNPSTSAIMAYNVAPQSR